MPDSLLSNYEHEQRSLKLTHYDSCKKLKKAFPEIPKDLWWVKRVIIRYKQENWECREAYLGNWWIVMPGEDKI